MKVYILFACMPEEDSYYPLSLHDSLVNAQSAQLQYHQNTGRYMTKESIIFFGIPGENEVLEVESSYMFSRG